MLNLGNWLFVARCPALYVSCQRDNKDEAPDVLAENGNTVSAGAIVAFHKFREDLSPGDKGLICSFGAGYSVGSLLVEKIKAGVDLK